MKVHERAGRLVVLAMSAMLVFTGAAWPLNPLVERRAQPGVAPAECAESLAPAPAPRVDVAQIPAREIEPVSIPAPPSRSLRSELEAAQIALDRNDRPAFDAHLATARDILRDYPPGAERNAAEEAVRAFDDAARIWDAQFESPFFDQNSDAYARASRYPGYENAVRRGVFTDDAERRFYPAAESRDFVARAAAERLTRLGIRTPTQRARIERGTRGVDRLERPPTASPSISRATTTATAGSARRITRPKSSVSPARRKPTTTSSSSSLAKSGKSVAPAAVASASPDPPTSANPATEPAPAAPTATAPTPVPTASPVAEGTAPPTDTTATEPTTTTAAPETANTTSTTTEAAEPERRSVIVPALLILIGLGVLIVLFRASK